MCDCWNLKLVYNTNMPLMLIIRTRTLLHCTSITWVIREQKKKMLSKLSTSSDFEWYFVIKHSRTGFSDRYKWFIFKWMFYLLRIVFARSSVAGWYFFLVCISGFYVSNIFHPFQLTVFPFIHFQMLHLWNVRSHCSVIMNVWNNCETALKTKIV